MRETGVRQVCLAAIIICLALMASACTRDDTSDTRINVERPAGKAAIPVSIGVYFSPEFLAFEHRLPTSGLGGTKMIFRFGQTSADLFDGVFNTAFEEVHFVESRPPMAAGAPSVAAVIEPRIERARVHGRLGTYASELVYQFRLYDQAGNLVLSWNTSGQAISNPESKIIYDGRSQPVQDDALKQAGENLMRSLYNDPRILTWFASQGVSLTGQ